MTPNVSAFIRSYRGDIPWLKYCLRALRERGNQFSQIVLCVPYEEHHEFLPVLKETDTKGRVELRTCEPIASDGYIDQQITKCHADMHCRCDFIMHFDSDCIALREIELSEFFAAGRPKLLFRRWYDSGTAIVWEKITSYVLKAPAAFETMASHPFIYHRSTHELFRRHIRATHKMEFIEFMQRQKEFSEFNAIGNFCHQATPDAYYFIRAGADDGFPRPFRQFWSRGELIPEDIEKLL